MMTTTKPSCFQVASVLLMLLSVAIPIASGQSLYPLRGGTRFEPGSINKNRLVLVAENSEMRITIDSSDKFKPKRGDVWVFWMKIENLTGRSITFDPTKYHATDDEGRGLAGLDSNVAIKRFEDSIAGTMNSVGLIMAGPLMGPSMTNASERGSFQRLNQMSFRSGDIPPKSFKDGLVYFEKSKVKTKEVKVFLTGIWTDPIILTSEEKLRPKPAK